MCSLVTRVRGSCVALAGGPIVLLTWLSLAGCTVAPRAAMKPQPDRAAEFDQHASARGEVKSDSVHGALSADGRFVAFMGRGDDLVPGDANRAPDVFVHDRLTGVTERVSVAADGGDANAGSDAPSISATGRYVAFHSNAANLTPDDAGEFPGIFRCDRATRTTTRVSVAFDGGPANGVSSNPCISADGTRIAFHSVASNLVPGDTNDCGEVFVRDVAAGWTRRVSVGTDGAQANRGSSAPAISGDGRWVAFASHAANLVPDDTNDKLDVFVHDLVSGVTERVSVGPHGEQSLSPSNAPTLSHDGRWVAFTGVPALVDPQEREVGAILIRDRQAGTTWRVPLPPAAAGQFAFAQAPAISADGQRMAFEGWNDAQDPQDNTRLLRIFVHDVPTRQTWAVSTTADGRLASGDCVHAALSANGRHVAFESKAPGIVKEDENKKVDVFVRDLERPQAVRTSVPTSAASAAPAP